MFYRFRITPIIPFYLCNARILWHWENGRKDDFLSTRSHFRTFTFKPKPIQYYICISRCCHRNTVRRYRIALNHLRNCHRNVCITSKWCRFFLNLKWNKGKWICLGEDPNEFNLFVYSKLWMFLQFHGYTNYSNWNTEPGISVNFWFWCCGK